MFYHLIKYDLSLYFIEQYVCFRYSLAIAPVGAPVNVDIPVSKLTSLTLHLDRILAFLIELAALFNLTFVQVLDKKLVIGNIYYLVLSKRVSTKTYI